MQHRAKKVQTAGPCRASAIHRKRRRSFRGSSGGSAEPGKGRDLEVPRLSQAALRRAYTYVGSRRTARPQPRRRAYIRRFTKDRYCRPQPRLFVNPSLAELGTPLQPNYTTSRDCVVSLYYTVRGKKRQSTASRDFKTLLAHSLELCVGMYSCLAVIVGIR